MDGYIILISGVALIGLIFAIVFTIQDRKESHKTKEKHA